MNDQNVFTVAVLPMKHIFEIKEGSTHDRTVHGIEAKLLNTLSQHMAFQFKLVSPEDKQWGYQFSNGTWSGIIGMLTRSEADMGLNYLSITENRIEHVDFSIPYTVLDRTFATDAPELLASFSSFLYPFTVGVWLLSLLLLLLAPLVFKLVIQKKDWGSIAVKVFGSLCKQPMDFEAYSWEFRVLLGSWWVYATFLTLAYSTVLLSFLTVPLRAKGIDSIKELSEAVQNEGYRCLAAKGSADNEFILKSQLEYVNIIGKAIKKNSWLYDPINGLPHNLGQKTALIGARMRMHIVYGAPPYSSKHISEFSFGLSHVAIALRKGFCCRDMLNTVLLRVLSSGLYQKWVEDEMYLSKVKNRSWKTYGVQQDVSLSLYELQGIFILLLAGYLASFSMFICELWYR